MAFWLDRFRREDEEDIWKDLKQIFLNQPSEQEIALKEKDEQAKIDAVLEKMFPDVEKPKKESYLEYEDLFDEPKTLVGEPTGMSASPKHLESFGQNLFNGLNTNKNIFPDLGKVTQKSLNNNSMQNNITLNQDLTWKEKAIDNVLKDEKIIRK